MRDRQTNRDRGTERQTKIQAEAERNRVVYAKAEIDRHSDLRKKKSGQN